MKAKVNQNEENKEYHFMSNGCESDDDNDCRMLSRKEVLEKRKRLENDSGTEEEEERERRKNEETEEERTRGRLDPPD